MRLIDADAMEAQRSVLVMACYRDGGCGPYEMYSCDECPASKPDYKKGYPPYLDYPKERKKQTNADKIRQMPTVDAVPVVRCCECKYWDRDWKSWADGEEHYCPMIDLVTDSDFFCKYGKKGCKQNEQH